jgi:Delta3-Delta2-enoyl-CoA isomerase
MNALVACKLPSASVVRDVILDGRRYGGEQALAAGLVDELGDSEEQVFAKAVALAEALLPKCTHYHTLHKLKREMFYHAYNNLASGVMESPPVRNEATEAARSVVSARL